MLDYHNSLRLYNKLGVLVIDNSSLSTYGECPRKFLYKCVLSLRNLQEKPSLTFGSAFHAALELYYQGADFETCFVAFTKAALKEGSKITITKEHAQELLNKREFSLKFGFELFKKYTQHYPLNTEFISPLVIDDKYMLEKGFAINLPNGILIGKIDFIGKKRGSKRNIIVEHKTTSQTLTPFYFSSFNPNTQVSSYLYATNVLMLNDPPECAIINAIRVKDYVRGEPEENAKKLFARIETRREPEALEQHIRHVDFRMGQICQSIEEGLDGFPQNAPYACTRYGNCEYQILCMAKNEEMISRLATSAFVSYAYEPYEVLEGVKEIVEIDASEDKLVSIMDKDEFVAKQAIVPPVKPDIIDEIILDSNSYD